MRTGLVSALIVLGALPVVHPALAAEPTKQECVDANDAAQDLRRAGKLIEAREKLLLCASASCPGPVREDCAPRLAETDKATPTLVFEARDADGLEVKAVRVTMDGTWLTATLDGAPLTINPGKHTFTFEADGFDRVEQSLLVREGVKGTREQVMLRAVGKGQPTPAVGAAPPPAATETAQPPVSTTESSTGTSSGFPKRTAAYVALGVGGVGVVAGSVFGALALGKKSSLDGACTNHACPPSEQSDIDGMHTNAVVSNIALGVGIVGLGTGGVLWFLSRDEAGASQAPEHGSGPRISPWVGFGAAGVSGSFR
jgi:hypothetical protein